MMGGPFGSMVLKTVVERAVEPLSSRCAGLLLRRVLSLITGLDRRWAPGGGCFAA
jgi:hypothetical protein